jgi:hypothetical protein
VINNFVELEKNEWISSPYEFLLTMKNLEIKKSSIKVGLNNIPKNHGALKGGGSLISIKIYNINLIMQAENETK